MPINSNNMAFFLILELQATCIDFNFNITRATLVPDDKLLVLVNWNFFLLGKKWSSFLSGTSVATFNMPNMSSCVKIGQFWTKFCQMFPENKYFSNVVNTKISGIKKCQTLGDLFQEKCRFKA